MRIEYAQGEKAEYKRKVGYDVIERATRGPLQTTDEDVDAGDDPLHDVDVP